MGHNPSRELSADWRQDLYILKQKSRNEIETESVWSYTSSLHSSKAFPKCAVTWLITSAVPFTDMAAAITRIKQIQLNAILFCPPRQQLTK
jgi:hypothetical protein